MQLVPLLLLSIFEASDQGQVVKIRRQQGVEEPPAHPLPRLPPEQASVALKPWMPPLVPDSR